MCKPLTVFKFDFELQNFHTKNCVKYLKLKFKLFLTFFLTFIFIFNNFYIL